MKIEAATLTHDEDQDGFLSKKNSKNLGRFAAGQRQRAPEARHLHVPQKAPEHIGHMLVTAESKAGKERSLPGTEKRIDTLSRAELLGLSEKILVDGTTLRQIYETHLIGERGLRRLIAEYVRGGDLKKVLRQEVVEREIDFERDPVLRDMVPQFQASDSSGISSAALTQLLKKVTIEGVEEGEVTAFYKARANYEAQELVHHQKQRRVVDVGITAIIVILLVLIIILFLTRR